MRGSAQVSTRSTKGLLEATSELGRRITLCKLVCITKFSSTHYVTNFNYSAEKPTQLNDRQGFPSLQEIINAVQRMYDNNPNDDDMKLVQKAAETHTSWIAVCV